MLERWRSNMSMFYDGAEALMYLLLETLNMHGCLFDE